MATARVLVAGLRGGSGKTLVSLGLASAWRNRGREVAVFKKGPDYIDAAWLSAAAGTSCRNLDMFLMSPDAVLRSWMSGSASADVAVIEGNRGLFDGLDGEGATSTAELAKLLQAPVVLTVDCTKATRTIAALVLGCQTLDPDLPLRGVVLNRVAGIRHEVVLRDAIQRICDLPVVGAIGKIPRQSLPERHLGLVPPQEHDAQGSALREVAAIAGRHLDLERLWQIARTAPELPIPMRAEPKPQRPRPAEVRIGVFRDQAFQFYYPENLAALRREGARLIEISPLADPVLPDVDAVYMGGGFPETAAQALADNASFRASLSRAIEHGLPVYAECGGAVYLGETLLYRDGAYPMTAVLPITFAFQPRPQGHGYTILETVRDNPFSRIGDTFRGHEFHYTYMHPPTSGELHFAFRVVRGHGFDGESDGLCYRNVLACYTHVHALGTETWAPSLVRAAIRHRATGNGAQARMGGANVPD